MTSEPTCTTIDMSGWPARLCEVAEIIGAAHALALVDTFGGIGLYIPSLDQLGRDHHIVRVIGWDAARLLSEFRGGEHFEVPTLYYARAKKSRILAAVGSNRAIAMTFGVTESYVRRLRVGMRDRDDAQGSLF